MFRTSLITNTSSLRLVRRDHWMPTLPSTNVDYVEWEPGVKLYVDRVEFPDEPVSRPNYPESKDPIVITFRGALPDADRVYYLTRGWEELP